MEQDLLLSMLAEREERLSELSRNAEGQEDKASEARKKLEDARAQSSEMDVEFQEQVKVVKKRRQIVKIRILECEKELHHHGTSVVYMDAVKKAAPEMAPYILRMQGQLCSGMHTLFILETQLDAVKEISAKLVKALKDDIANVVEETGTVDLKAMNDLVALDDQKRQSDESYKKLFQGVEVQREGWKQELGEDDSDDASQDCDGDSEDEKDASSYESAADEEDLEDENEDNMQMQRSGNGTAKIEEESSDNDKDDASPDGEESPDNDNDKEDEIFERGEAEEEKQDTTQISNTDEASETDEEEGYDGSHQDTLRDEEGVEEEAQDAAKSNEWEGDEEVYQEREISKEDI